MFIQIINGEKCENFAEQIKIIIESLMEFIESKNHLEVDISKNYWEDLYEKLEEFLLKGENKKIL